MPTREPRRVFVATPGDLKEVRVRVKDVVETFSPTGTHCPFVAVGWEATIGGAARPQAVINEELWKCDYVVVIFRSAWGSATGSRWGYTSGTEEELFTGLLALHDQDAPVRDVWVIFLDAPRVHSKVAQLREQLDSEHSLYYSTFASEDDLVSTLSRKLGIWNSDVAEKQALTVDLTPSSGMEVLKADILRRDGLTLANIGYMELAEEKLALAANYGDPRAMLEYARFMARQRRFDEAVEWNDKVIKMQAELGGGLHSAEAAEAYSNIGHVERRRSRPIDAAQRHESALGLITGRDERSLRTRAKVLDALGLARDAAGDLLGAVRAFNESLTLREGMGDELGLVQSHVNLARLKFKQNDLIGARAHCDLAMPIVDKAPPSLLSANAYTLLAQVEIEEGRLAEACEAAVKGLALNRQAGYESGQAICHKVLAESCLRSGELDAAERSAKECLSINSDTHNDQGIAIARALLGRIDSQRRGGSS